MMDPNKIQLLNVKSVRYGCHEAYRQTKFGIKSIMQMVIEISLAHGNNQRVKKCSFTKIAYSFERESQPTIQVDFFHFHYII